MGKTCPDCGADDWNEQELEVDDVSGTKITVWKTCRQCGNRNR